MTAFFNVLLVLVIVNLLLLVLSVDKANDPQKK